MKQRIVPSVIASSKKEFSDYIKKIKPYFDRVQVDITDGKFVPSKGLKIEDEPKLPKDIHFEIHLMMYGGERHLPAVKKQGYSTVLFSYEAFKRKDLEKALMRARGLGLRAGFVLKPETEISVVKSFADKIDQVTLLSVHPGFYGKPFIPATISRLKKLVRLRKDCAADFLIEVDGGVNLSNIKKVAQTGVDLIIVGSALHSSKNLKKTLAELNKEMRR